MKEVVIDLNAMEKITNYIMSDPSNLAILFELGRKSRLKFPTLSSNLKLKENILTDKVMVLEAEKYIKQNPSKDKTRPFKDRKYMLDLKGIFLLNKIRIRFPEYSESFNFSF